MILALIWSKIKGWVLAAGAVAGVLLGAYLKGRTDASKTVETKVLKDRIQSIETAKEVSDEVRKMPESDLDRNLDRFMRD